MTFSIESARTSARIYTFFINASSWQRTIRWRIALRSTRRRTTGITRQTRANSLRIYMRTLRVGSTWAWNTCIMGRSFFKSVQKNYRRLASENDVKRQILHTFDGNAGNMRIPCQSIRATTYGQVINYITNSLTSTRIDSTRIYTFVLHTSFISRTLCIQQTFWLTSSIWITFVISDTWTYTICTISIRPTRWRATRIFRYGFVFWNKFVI